MFTREASISVLSVNDGNAERREMIWPLCDGPFEPESHAEMG